MMIVKNKKKRLVFGAIALLVVCAGIFAIQLIDRVPSINETTKTCLARESILDHIISISTNVVFDIPHYPSLCDKITWLEKGFIDVYNGRLYYEAEGQGVSLVLISGGPGCTHQVFHPYFSRVKDVAHIIYYDQRGTGQSSSDDTGKTYTVKHAVDDLEALRKALKIKTWIVLGHSYGGLLAQCYALTYPQSCSGLVLCAATTGVPSVVTQPIRDHLFIAQAEQEAIDRVTQMTQSCRLTTAQAIYNKLIAGDWKRQFYYKPTTQELIRKAMYSWNPAEKFEKYMRPDSDATSLEGCFNHCKIPTLIIEGKYDLLWWDPKRADVMRKNHPNARVAIFEKAGHNMFVDDQEMFFTLLKDFVLQCG